MQSVESNLNTVECGECSSSNLGQNKRTRIKFIVVVVLSASEHEQQLNSVPVFARLYFKTWKSLVIFYQVRFAKACHSPTVISSVLFKRII